MQFANKSFQFSSTVVLKTHHPTPNPSVLQNSQMYPNEFTFNQKRVTSNQFYQLQEINITSREEAPAHKKEKEGSISRSFKPKQARFKKK